MLQPLLQGVLAFSRACVFTGSQSPKTTLREKSGFWDDVAAPAAEFVCVCMGLVFCKSCDVSESLWHCVPRLTGTLDIVSVCGLVWGDLCVGRFCM